MVDASSGNAYRETPLSIAVIGASGDLAMRKIFPALFSLYCRGLLPRKVRIAGFARSAIGDAAFRKSIAEKLVCHYVSGATCVEDMASFLDSCVYVQGDYGGAATYPALDAAMRHPGAETQNRVFYMAIPPFLFLDTARAMRDAGLSAGVGDGWTRVVIEKPFGSDRVSSDALTQGMAQVFTEEQTYRIDHYLGKEIVQNLMVLRFANLIFDPIWNRSHIHDVRISWMEDLSLEGRAGYFDQYGIIRDVMQNHLLQMMALIAMEQPLSLNAEDVRDEKVKTLRAIPPVELSNIIIGQYSEGHYAGRRHAPYREEKDVPRDSRCPTFAACLLQVRNRRWDGVPFLMRAGKGLNARMTEIRIRFQPVPGNIFAGTLRRFPPNELVIRVQPDESIAFRIVNKAPGLDMTLEETRLDLRYAAAFDTEIPDAYESLLLDVLQGDKSLFIRADELEAAWDIFTPVLHGLEEKRIRPQLYPFGGMGPEAAYGLASRYGVVW